MKHLAAPKTGPKALTKRVAQLQRQLRISRHLPGTSCFRYREQKHLILGRHRGETQRLANVLGLQVWKLGEDLVTADPIGHQVDDVVSGDPQAAQRGAPAKNVQALPEDQVAEKSLRHKLAIWYAKQLPKDDPLLKQGRIARCWFRTASLDRGISGIGWV
jgi:hypothetical protein